jgi:hypothetical protein
LERATPLFLCLQLFNIPFFSCLFFPTLVQSLFFHPLSHFPGKRIKSATNLYEAYLQFQDISAPVMKDMHNEFRDFIRTGPNHLSINNVEAMKLFLRQPFINCGPFYGNMISISRSANVLTVQDPETHRAWRKIGDRAFTKAALQDYAPCVEHHIARFVSIIGDRTGEEVNCLPLVQNLTYVSGIRNYKLEARFANECIIGCHGGSRFRETPRNTRWRR